MSPHSLPTVRAYLRGRRSPLCSTATEARQTSDDEDDVSRGTGVPTSSHARRARPSARGGGASRHGDDRCFTWNEPAQPPGQLRSGDATRDRHGPHQERRTGPPTQWRPRVGQRRQLTLVHADDEAAVITGPLARRPREGAEADSGWTLIPARAASTIGTQCWPSLPAVAPDDRTPVHPTAIADA